MPYRVDLPDARADAFDRLVEIGALDIEAVSGGLAALLPDGISPEQVARTLGVNHISVSDARGRDDGSVWVLSPGVVHFGTLQLGPADRPPEAGMLRLVDGNAFGTGLHPTTALCLEALAEIVAVDRPARVLDVGTGSGVLALAALVLGVARAVGVDIDPDALVVAAENARINDLTDRLELVQGDAAAVQGSWPLVLANVVAAPLIEMAPTLVRRLGHQGRLVLSGIPWAVAPDVEQSYRRLGLRSVSTATREGWTALVLGASW